MLVQKVFWMRILRNKITLGLPCQAGRVLSLVEWMAKINNVHPFTLIPDQRRELWICGSKLEIFNNSLTRTSLLFLHPMLSPWHNLKCIFFKEDKRYVGRSCLKCNFSLCKRKMMLLLLNDRKMWALFHLMLLKP